MLALTILTGSLVSGITPPVADLFLELQDAESKLLAAVVDQIPKDNNKRRGYEHLLQEPFLTENIIEEIVRQYEPSHPMFETEYLNSHDKLTKSIEKDKTIKNLMLGIKKSKENPVLANCYRFMIYLEEMVEKEDLPKNFPIEMLKHLESMCNNERSK